MITSNMVAKSFTIFFKTFADICFQKRYGHRAVVLETVAAVPGMVAGMWIHLKSLRKMRTGYGPIIRELLAEAENERMHLMFFVEITKPIWIERIIILVAQFVFWNYYFVFYVFFPKTAHRMVGYFEDEAVQSYTNYLEMIELGEIDNINAPTLAINYYNLPTTAKLSDMIKCVRADETHHAQINHAFADDPRTY